MVRTSFFGLKWHLELLCKTLIHLIFHSESWFWSICSFPSLFFSSCSWNLQEDYGFASSFTICAYAVLLSKIDSSYSRTCLLPPWLGKEHVALRNFPEGRNNAVYFCNVLFYLIIDTELAYLSEYVSYLSCGRLSIVTHPAPVISHVHFWLFLFIAFRGNAV